MIINEFVWDKKNIIHIALHKIMPYEIEEIAFDDKPHIRNGRQGVKYLFGQTIGGRYIFVVFVIRDKKTYVVTARDMDKKERRLYQKVVLSV